MVRLRANKALSDATGHKSFTYINKASWFIFVYLFGMRKLSEVLLFQFKNQNILNTITQTPWKLSGNGRKFSSA